MTETESTRRYAATCISRSSASHANSVLRGALNNYLAREMELQSLGEWEQQFASDVIVDLHEADLADVRVRLSAAAGDTGDTAILPAAGRRKRLLISDMDSTIIGQECLDELADFAGLKSEVSAITERAMRGDLDFDTALTTRVRMLDGLGLDALQACFDARITLNPGARTLVATMRALGAETLLVSGGFTFFTERVAALAGFHDHQGNTLIDDGSRLTGAVGQPILGREAKRNALNDAAGALGLTVGDALTLGDGANDLAMIKTSGLGLAYRAKPVVAAEADAAINVCDLTAALFFQGIHARDFVAP